MNRARLDTVDAAVEHSHVICNIIRWMLLGTESAETAQTLSVPSSVFPAQRDVNPQ